MAAEDDGLPGIVPGTVGLQTPRADLGRPHGEEGEELTEPDREAGCALVVTLCRRERQDLRAVDIDDLRGQADIHRGAVEAEESEAERRLLRAHADDRSEDEKIGSDEPTCGGDIGRQRGIQPAPLHHRIQLSAIEDPQPTCCETADQLVGDALPDVDESRAAGVVESSHGDLQRRQNPHRLVVELHVHVQGPRVVQLVGLLDPVERSIDFHRQDMRSGRCCPRRRESFGSIAAKRGERDEVNLAIVDVEPDEERAVRVTPAGVLDGGSQRDERAGRRNGGRDLQLPDDEIRKSQPDLSETSDCQDKTSENAFRHHPLRARGYLVTTYTESSRKVSHRSAPA